MSRYSNSFISPSIALAATTLLCGCIPVNMSEPFSPSIVGVLRHIDGTPRAHVRMGLSSAWKNECAKTVAHTETDTAGVFRFPPMSVQRHWVIVIPPVERFGTSYTLCAEAEDSRLASVYRKYHNFSELYHEAADSLTCQEWAWQDSMRVTCAAQRESALQTGGRWSDSAASGTYRLIVATDWQGPREPRVLLQWVQLGAPGQPERVVATRPMPLARKNVRVLEATLSTDTAMPPCVSVRSKGNPVGTWHWNDEEVHADLQLGPPGVTRPVANCRDKDANKY